MPAPPPSAHPRSRTRGALALASVAVGALTAFSALTPPIATRLQILETLEPSSARALAGAVSLLCALLLAVLAPGLARGSRRAAARTVAVLYLTAVAHAVKGLDLEEAVLALGLALVVRASVRPGATDAEPGRTVLAGAVLLGALSGAFALEIGALLISGAHVHLGTAMLRAALGLVGGRSGGAGGPDLLLWSADALTVVGALAGARWLLGPLRPDPGREGHSTVAHEHAAELVQRWGEDSLAPFALRCDKAFFFARGAVVAYRTVGRTAVVAGDPVGPPGSAAPALAAFRAWAERCGWDSCSTQRRAGAPRRVPRPGPRGAAHRLGVGRRPGGLHARGARGAQGRASP